MSALPQTIRDSQAAISIYTYIWALEGTDFTGVGDVRIEKIITQIDDLEMRKFYKESLNNFTNFNGRLQNVLLANKYKGAGDLLDVFDYEEVDEGKEETLEMVSNLFIAIILLNFFIGFFSLISTTLTNLSDQKREIGVLRSIGVTNYGISRVFFYECLVVVLVGVVLGNLIGMGIGWLYVEQSKIFFGGMAAVPFSYNMILTMVGSGILSAFAAGMIPAFFEVRSGVVNLIKGD